MRRWRISPNTTQNTNIGLTLNNASGASLGGTTTRTASGGQATFNDILINKNGTNYSLTAAGGNVCNGNSTACATVTSNAFNVLIGPASQLAFSAQPTTTQSTSAINSPTGVKVQLLDAGGNLTSSTASVTMAIANNGGTPTPGTLSGTLTVAAGAGTATFTTLSINKVGTGYTLAASSGALTGATSAGFNITVGPAARLGIVTNPFTVARNLVSPQIVVQLQDAGGNAIAPASHTSATTIFFASSSTGGRFRTTPAGANVTSTSMAAGTNQVAFYYTDTKNGSPTIRAKDQSGTTDTLLVDASQVESITVR